MNQKLACLLRQLWETPGIIMCFFKTMSLFLPRGPAWTASLFPDGSFPSKPISSGQTHLLFFLWVDSSLCSQSLSEYSHPTQFRAPCWNCLTPLHSVGTSVTQYRFIEVSAQLEVVIRPHRILESSVFLFILPCEEKNDLTHLLTYVSLRTNNKSQF